MKQVRIFGNAHLLRVHHDWIQIEVDDVLDELCKRHPVLAIHLDAGRSVDLLNESIDDVLEAIDAVNNDEELAGCVRFFKRRD